MVCKKVLVVLHEEWVQEKSKFRQKPSERLLEYFNEYFRGDVHILDKASSFFALIVLIYDMSEPNMHSFIKEYLIDNFNIQKGDIDSVVAIKHDNIDLMEAERLIRKNIDSGKMTGTVDIVKAYNSLATWFIRKSNYYESAKCFEECAKVLLATQNVLVNHEVVRARTLMSAGYTYNSAGCYIKALKCCLQGMDALKALFCDHKDLQVQYMDGITATAEVLDKLSKPQITKEYYNDYLHPMKDMEKTQAAEKAFNDILKKIAKQKSQ